MKKAIVFIVVLMMLCFVSSCIYMCSKRHEYFKNCTNDTLLVGHSCYDSVDSIDCQMYSSYFVTSAEFDTVFIPVKKNVKFRGDMAVLPDSTFSIVDWALFKDHDTCYFYLIKWRDIRHNSWKEICSKKLYHKYMVVRNKDGNFDRNIRYGK